MRTLIISLFISLLLFNGNTAYGKKAKTDPVVQKIIELGTTDNKAMEHLDILTNRIGGRIVGSDNLNTAERWAAEQFKSWGYEVVVQEVRTLPVGFNRGPWFGKMIGDNGMSLHFTTPSYTSGTKGVQRGHVVKEPKTRAEFDRVKGTLKGAWVLITGTNTGWPVDFTEKGDQERAAIIKENEEISRKNNEIRAANRNSSTPQELIPLKDAPALFYKEMVEAGILGIIQSAPVPITTLYDRKNVETLSWDNLPKVPDIKLNEHQYKAIELKVTEREYFQLEFDIRNHFRMGPVKIHNILAIKKGSKYPDEMIIAGAHLDAFDVATGGVDCGSGTAATMEAARLFALSGAKPKKTVMFALWTAEEFGLWGSKFWVENNTDKLGKIVNYFNRDGGPTAASGLNVPPTWYDALVDICAPLEDLNPDIPFVLRKNENPPRPKPTTAGGSDHAHFALNGVPTIGFSTTDPLGYDFSYREIWHTDRDLYNKSIPEYQEYSAITNAVVIYGLSMLDKTLPRKEVYAE